MNYLLLMTLCGSDAAFMGALLEEHWECYVLYLIFVFIGTMTIMNMLIGVICEVVATVAEREETDLFIEFGLPRLGELLSSLDTDGNCCISQDEFFELLKDPAMLKALLGEGIDVEALVDVVPFFFRDCDEMSLDEFLGMITDLRGSKAVNVKDLVVMRKFVSDELRLVLSGSQRICGTVSPSRRGSKSPR